MEEIVEGWHRRLCSSLVLVLLKPGTRLAALVDAVKSKFDAAIAWYSFFALLRARRQVKDGQEGIVIRRTFAFFCLQHTQAFATRARARSFGNVCELVCSQTTSA